MPKRLTSYEQKIRNENFANGLLWCSCCDRFLPINDFYKCSGKTSNYGRRFYCIVCENTKKRDKEKARRLAKERNGALKKKFVELAGGCCQRCGFDTFRSALSYHHVFPSQKEHNPVTVVYGGNVQMAWDELNKCCLLCLNCHFSYEAREWRAEFIKRDGLGWTVEKDLPLDDKRYDNKNKDVHITPIPEDLIELNCEQLSLIFN